MDTSTSLRLLRLADVSELTTLGKSTINLWVAQGKFPAPTAISPTIKVWRRQDVEEWIENAFSKPPTHTGSNGISTGNVFDFLPSGFATDSKRCPMPVEQQVERL